MKKLFLFLALSALFAERISAQLTQKGQETTVAGCTSSNCVLVPTNTPVNPNLTSAGINTFLIGVTPPTNAVRLYITNNTANACSNLTISMASTGNATVTSFNNNVAAWQSLQIQSGSTGFGASAPITLPANGTVAITSQPIIGTRLAVFVVLSSGCLTTSVDMQVVFGTFTPTIGSVQGVIPPGNAATGENPVLVGFQNAAGNVAIPYVCGAFPAANDCAGFSLTGIAIGGQNIGLGSTFNTARTPAGPQDGPLAVTPWISIGSTGGASSGSLRQTSTASQGGSCGAGTANCGGLFVADAGFTFSPTSFGPITANGVQGLWQTASQFNSGAASSMITNCYFTVKVINNSGTAPTLDLYLSDSADGVDFNDRIHFNQFTTGTSVQVAGIAGGSANYPVGAPTANTIAVGTIVSGPLGSAAEFRWVVGGTAPNYNLVLGAACK